MTRNTVCRKKAAKGAAMTQQKSKWRMSKGIEQHFGLAAPTDYRLTELGTLPEERRVAWLGQIIESQQRKALLAKARSGTWKRPFSSAANALWGKIDLTVDDEMRFEPTQGQRLALQAGESQVCKRGDIRRVAIWMGGVRPDFHQDHLHGLRAKRTSGAWSGFSMCWQQTARTFVNRHGGSDNRTAMPHVSPSRLACVLVSPGRCQGGRKVRISCRRSIARLLPKRRCFQTLLHDVMTARRRLPEDFIGQCTSGARHITALPTNSHGGCP
jgi:hypothetical protein